MRASRASQTQPFAAGDGDEAFARTVNRNGLVVEAESPHANGHGEHKAALEMVNRHFPGSTRHLTLRANKGYNSANFVAALRRMVVTRMSHRRSGIPPSMGAPPGIPATPCPSDAGRRSRNPSAGPRRWAIWPKPSTSASTGSARNSP